MSTLTASDINQNNIAFGVLTIGVYLLHYLAVLASADVSKSPQEDGFVPTEGSPPMELPSGSKGERFARIAGNNRDNLFQAVFVFLVAKLYVERGSNPTYNTASVDNRTATRFLTIVMWTYFSTRVTYTIAYLYGYNSPVPFRSLSWLFGLLSALCACGTVVWAMANFHV